MRFGTWGPDCRLEHGPGKRLVLSDTIMRRQRRRTRRLVRLTAARWVWPEYYLSRGTAVIGRRENVAAWGCDAARGNNGADIYRSQAGPQILRPDRRIP